MKVLLLCPNAFETMEFSVFIDILGWARNDFGYDIDVITCGFQKQVISTFQVSIEMDTIIDDIIVSDYDALAIPGGFREFGFFEEGFASRTVELIQEFDAQHKPIAAICIAAFLLANSGILKGRKATTYHLHQGAEQRKLAAYGVRVVNEPVVIDANVITSYCPQTAPDVAFALLEMLTSHTAMQEVKHAMGFEIHES